MVGHTGDMEATVVACKAANEAVKQVFIGGCFWHATIKIFVLSVACLLISSPYVIFFDSTQLGRILSCVPSDLSITELNIPFSLFFSCCAALNAIRYLGVLFVLHYETCFVGNMEIPLGGFAMPYDKTRAFEVERGYHMVSGAVDLGMLRKAAEEDVRRFREAVTKIGEEERDDERAKEVG